MQAIWADYEMRCMIVVGRASDIDMHMIQRWGDEVRDKRTAFDQPHTQVVTMQKATAHAHTRSALRELALRQAPGH